MAVWILSGKTANVQTNQEKQVRPGGSGQAAFSDQKSRLDRFIPLPAGFCGAAHSGENGRFQRDVPEVFAIRVQF